MTRALNRHPRVHKNLFGVMVVQMTVLVVKNIFTTSSSDQSGSLLSLKKPHKVFTGVGDYCITGYKSTIKDTYTSGVFDLFLPLKNSGKALLSMAWTLQRHN